MRVIVPLVTALLLSVISTAAQAALAVGDKAPDFTTRASLAGKEFDFNLKEALKKGPVVLYFYPAAFTKGCTIEAHDFAEATDKFKSLGATVIGVSRDDIEKLNRFSVSECRNKFAVAADGDGSVVKAYDVDIIKGIYSDRTSYVISPEGRILLSYTNLNPDQHVDLTMRAVEVWSDRQKYGKSNKHN